MVRKRMIGLVYQALRELDLPDEVVRFADSLQRRLAGWSVSLSHELERQSAGRMSRVDDPLQLLAAVTAWALWESEYRDVRSLRSDRPGFLAGKRLAKFNSVQASFFIKHTVNMRGFGSQAVPTDAFARVVALLFAFRFPSKLHSIAGALGRLVGPRIREELAEARRVSQQKQLASAEKTIRDMVPFGVNPDGTRDILRAAHFVETLRRKESEDDDRP